MAKRLNTRTPGFSIYVLFGLFRVTKKCNPRSLFLHKTCISLLLFYDRSFYSFGSTRYSQNGTLIRVQQPSGKNCPLSVRYRSRIFVFYKRIEKGKSKAAEHRTRNNSRTTAHNDSTRCTL